MDGQRLHVNGIDRATDEYLVPPTTARSRAGARPTATSSGTG
jgi:hypothetical protein